MHTDDFVPDVASEKTILSATALLRMFPGNSQPLGFRNPDAGAAGQRQSSLSERRGFPDPIQCTDHLL
jgi:hypothetical protein